MCKSKAEGGLRCAGHTRPALVKAYERYQANPTQKNLDKLNEKREQYLETPEGYEQAIALNALPNGALTYIDEETGEERDVPLQDLGDYPATPTKVERRAMADVFRERHEKKKREWAAQQAARAAEEVPAEEPAADPDEPVWKDEQESDDEWDVYVAGDADTFGEAQEPIEGEELDADGYGVISGINEAGFRRDGTHYATGTPYDEFGVDEQGWTELGINAETGRLVDAEGRNRRGFDIQTGIHRNGTRYDDDGYDISGVDSEGWRADGWNATRTRHRDTYKLPHPHNKYDSQGYGADGRDAFGYSKFDGTNKYNFLPNRKYAPRQHLPPPQCYLDERGFDSAGIHHETGKRLDPKGYDRDGYDIDWMDRQGRLHPEVAPNRSTALIHTHGGYECPLVKAGLTERNGWTTKNARGSKKLIPVLVKTGFRYRKKPMRMMWEVGVVTLRHHKTQQQRKVYTAALHGTENRTVAFTEPDALKKFLEAFGIPSKPQGDPF